MNSRTIHSVLLFCVVSIFLITGTRAYAQAVSGTEEKIEAPVPQDIPTTPEPVTSQLPILSSDVGEILPKEPSPTPDEKPKKATEISVTPTISVKDTITPTPSHMPSLTPSPTQPVVQLQNTGGLDAEKLFSMSNDYRKSQGLLEFKKDDQTCSLAVSRAPEIAAEISSGNMHAGLKSRNLDYWNTENIISMRTEESAFNWWVNDKIHHDALVGDFTYSCVACSGNSCAQEFTNYQKK